MVHALQTTQNLVISRRWFAEDEKEMYKDHNARAQPLFSSLNLLFGGVPGSIVVVVS